MEIKISFNMRGRSERVPDAIRIAEKLKGQQEGTFMVVNCKEFSKEVQELLHLVIYWRRTEFEINGLKIEIKDFWLLKEVLLCKRNCRGNCKLVQGDDWWKGIIKALGLNGKIPVYDSKDEPECWFRHCGSEALLDISENNFRVDRDKLIEAYKNKFQVIDVVCPKYKESPYIEEIKKMDNDKVFQYKYQKPAWEDEDELEVGITPGEELFEQLEERQQERMQEFVMLVADEVEKRLLKILDRDDMKR
ncbi:hypothetical protein [Butyricimonas sp. Marseille-P3923]|uniref:hypothetical protein n=1 Tax=Butyricimonas sp. Marseille-P3923 TaxID=1987504 RepID=UPI000C08C474|nr:hypothetical protein [Butyricimonas sp. Marseille-P3923]